MLPLLCVARALHGPRSHEAHCSSDPRRLGRVPAGLQDAGAPVPRPVCSTHAKSPSFFQPLSAAQPPQPPSTSSRTDPPCFLLIVIYLICMWLFHYNSLNLGCRVARATERAFRRAPCCRGDPWPGSSCALGPPGKAQPAAVSCLFCLSFRRVSVTLLRARTTGPLPASSESCTPPPTRGPLFPPGPAGLL